MADLKEANRILLMRAGLSAANITVSDECTSCQSGKYWSHRRANTERGSQAAIIVMRGNML
jgi:copper oxidase (laccase) domain-containing protein